MEKVSSVSKDLHSRVPDSTVEKAATRAALQSLLEYHDSFSQEVEREQSTLALLVQQIHCLRGEAEKEVEKKMENGREDTPCLQKIRRMQEQYDRSVITCLCYHINMITCVTTMYHCGDGAFRVMCNNIFVPCWCCWSSN